MFCILTSGTVTFWFTFNDFFVYQSYMVNNSYIFFILFSCVYLSFDMVSKKSVPVIHLLTGVFRKIVINCLLISSHSGRKWTLIQLLP